MELEAVDTGQAVSPTSKSRLAQAGNGLNVDCNLGSKLNVLPVIQCAGARHPAFAACDAPVQRTQVVTDPSKDKLCEQAACLSRTEWQQGFENL